MGLVSTRYRWGREKGRDARIVMDGSADDEVEAGVGARRRVMSSAMFLAVNSPAKHTSALILKAKNTWNVLGFRSVITTPHRSNTAFSLPKSISRSVVPLVVPVGMIASFTESWMMRLSVFENKSLSTKSATPSSRMVVSANAMPTVFSFWDLEEVEVGEEAILMAITIGAVRRSVEAKRRSSTAWRLPGEACGMDVRLDLKGKKVERTSLSKRNFAHFFPWPASGTHISTFSCLLVRASRRSIWATLILRLTEGRPVDLPPGPRYFMTEFVW